MPEIVLVHQEIPANTGNIARTCVATHTPLHLIEPLGFSLSDKYMKRAGLDYWPRLQLQVWSSLEHFMESMEGRRFFLASSKGKQSVYETTFADGDLLFFGSETKGLPAAFQQLYPEKSLRIPMFPGERCLNLSNSVAVVLYEALRQQGFPQLQ